MCTADLTATCDTPGVEPSSDRPQWGPDLVAAVAVLFLAIPQGLAYATIAGLPPAMGLYASALPTTIGSFFRSSPFVLSGPTNALSLLVGSTLVASHQDPIKTAITLALLVGIMQVAAGVLRLGALIDYVSTPVITGYITGAGILIAIGQLPNATRTTSARGPIWVSVSAWIQGLTDAHLPSVVMTIGTVVALLLMRRLNVYLPRKLPSAIVALIIALVSTIVFSLEDLGIRVIADLSPIPRHLAWPSLPPLTHTLDLVPAAAACTVLSLIESSALARASAARHGHRFNASKEFIGQGLSNLTSALVGGYPVSGSLGRTTLNERAGAKSRYSGIVTGVLMLGVVVVFASWLDRVPIAALAGLLFVVSYDLVDRHVIGQIVRTSSTDAMVFGLTMLGTWALRFDTAIYLGVGLSLVVFLRQARLLKVRELTIDGDRVLEHHLATDSTRAIRLLHVEGSLFFGAAGELQAALDEAFRPSSVRVVVLRLKRTDGLDATTTSILAQTAASVRAQGRHLLIAGVNPDTMTTLERSGTLRDVGADNVFALPRDHSRSAILDTLKQAYARAQTLVHDGATISVTTVAPPRRTSSSLDVKSTVSCSD